MLARRYNPDHMSGDEMFVTAASILLGPIAWAWWLFRAASIDGLRKSRAPVVVMGTVVGLAGLLISAILGAWAAVDVRDAPQYIFMYFVMGLAWIRLAAFCFPMAGLNPRDDVIERRNAAALPAWTGAILGVALCYAGGNIGNGPGWWVVVFAATLATAALAAVWLAMGQWSGVVDAVVIDRDVAAGWRFGGLLTACGCIFGGAVMGDWVSAQATVIDFVARAWPVLPVVTIALMIERIMRPRPGRPPTPVIDGGVVPAIVYVSMAAASVALVWTTL